MSEELNWNWSKGPIGRLIKTGYITLRREVEELLKSTGLTHTQWSAIGIIHHYPGITSSQIEHILMIERPSVTSLMNGLSSKGLIIRKDHPEDGRSKQIFLTDEGEKLANETLPFAQIVESRVKEGLTEKEFETLKQLLIKMIRSFEKN